MDSFSEPALTQPSPPLPSILDTIRSLEDQHAAKGIPLSGRVIHVSHYLPLTCSLAAPSPAAAAPGILSPPSTPPADPAPDPSAAPPSPVALSPAAAAAPVPAKWHLGPRYGHAAMISGIRSLSATHQQLLVGWPGDIYAAPPAFSATQSPDNPDRPKIPAEGLRGDDRAALEDAIREYEDAEHEGGGRGLKLVPVWLDDKVAHGHYDGYCKQTLWPLFHYLLWQDVATEYASADRHWPAYEHANHAFADKLKQVYQPGDLVWVHDYHLLLVPQMVRQMLPDAYVGLFVHTPFPSSEVFRCLPRRKEILDGMLGANLVCFQTYSYSRHFTSSCVRVCGYEIAAGAKGIDVAGHVTGVRHCPVGVDAERVGKDVLRPGIQPKLEALRALYEGKKIIVGRDKLDVVKGVVQKLRAFNKLLTDYPEWRGRVVLIQVTSPALADSPRLERQISEIVAQVNGEWGSLDFVPVHHYHQTIKKDEFYALLSVADLGVITPLRDGMNTTSMEFVIAQERGGRSPLVLSEFMGISGDMGEAMLVNPWNLGEVAAAMNHGLLMSDEEKARRHASLYKQVTTHTSHTWAAMLVQMLLERVGAAGMARQTPRLPMDVMEGWYRRAGKRLFLFDYDGTLTPIVKTPSMAVPSEGTLEALAKLTADARNVVYIISGRDQAFLEQHLGHFAALGMSAEHGGFIREPGQEGWTNFTESLDMSWMSEVHEIFKYYTERTTGSHIEVKKSSITWHYRSSDPEWGAFQCRQCQDLLENNLVHKRPIEVLVGKKNLEVRPIAVNKGEIVKRILYLNPDAQFVFCAGDDKTDEDMFRALLFPSGATKWKMDAPLSVTLAVKDKSVHPQQELALAPEAIFTTAVGHSSKKTLASWHVTTPEEVVESMLNIVNDVKSSL